MHGNIVVHCHVHNYVLIHLCVVCLIVGLRDVQMLIAQAAPASRDGKQATDTLRSMAAICSTQALDVSRDLDMGDAHEKDAYTALLDLALTLWDEAVGQTVSCSPTDRPCVFRGFTGMHLVLEDPHTHALLCVAQSSLCHTACLRCFFLSKWHHFFFLASNVPKLVFC